LQIAPVNYYNPEALTNAATAFFDAPVKKDHPGFGVCVVIQKAVISTAGRYLRLKQNQMVKIDA